MGERVEGAAGRCDAAPETGYPTEPGGSAETDRGHRGEPAIDDTTERLLAALIAIDPEQAARVRNRTAARRRARTQRGPSATFGEDAPAG